MVKNKGDMLYCDTQERLEESVLEYQIVSKKGDKIRIEEAYQNILKIYNPFGFYHTWYDQYKYLFDSVEDFLSDYQKVFITVLLGWKPRNERKKSRYDGSGEFKNYFIGSLHHNYINMVKSDQAAKRNLTNKCPICETWVNPMSTHLITNHKELLWDYLEEINIYVDELTSCPLCTNFKVNTTTNSQDKITQLIKNHLMSKHSSLLFHKFNDMYPGVSTISPKSISSYVEDGDDEIDIYDSTEDSSGLLNKLYLMDLTDLQKSIIEQVLNGDSNLAYKSTKYKCTKDEWETAMEDLKETINICGHD